MYHYKARICSPTLGRFLQVDPIGYEDQVNLYAYVANDPVNMVDITGERAVTAGRVFVRAVINGQRVERALSDVAKEAAADWNELDADSDASFLEQTGSFVDLLAGTNLNDPAANNSENRRRETAGERRDKERSSDNNEPSVRGGVRDNPGDGPPGNNREQNRQFDSVVKERGLDRDQARQLHEEVTGQGLNRDQIIERADEMFPRR